MGDSGWASMPSQISDETIAAAAQALSNLSLAQQRPFAVVLHGGEPLLLGEVKLARLLAALRNALPDKYPLSIQTNGILITDKTLNLCSENRTSLSVSIDGPRHVHDRNRVGHSGRGTYDEVIRGIKWLSEHRDADFLFAGLLAVIDPTSAPDEVYGFFKGLNTPSVDFLYRDGNHTNLPQGKASLQSTEYGLWLSKLLDIYLADPNPPRIRLLDDLIKLVLGGSGIKEGVGITDFGIAIIDTDGTVTKNDTLKSSFNGADRFTQKWSVHKHKFTEILSSQEFTDYHTLQRPSSEVCQSCPELAVCGGGMTLHRWRDDNGYDNPSVYCADQMLLIRHIREQLSNLRVFA
jgi:uncharacterized protein